MADAPCCCQHTQDEGCLGCLSALATLLLTAACLWWILCTEARLSQMGHPITECWNPSPSKQEQPAQPHK